MSLLRRTSAAGFLAAPETADVALAPATLAGAGAIVEDVRARGEVALREHAERLGDVEPGAPLVLEPAELAGALEALAPEDRELLERSAERIERFARAQVESLALLDLAVPGGRAGHGIAAVDRAGCYAPGGRFPLPSSVLMTAVTARAAGVPSVWVASPRPLPITRAAAAVAGADALLAVGGAQAIAALALGAGPVPACDVVCGPGNRWVTAAKKLVAGEVAIDMLAGPSELLVLADGTADPALVAADLLAQAEHDEDARPLLVTLDPALAEAVEAELERQLSDLPTAPTARAALERNGRAILCADLDEAVRLCDLVAPEHLEVLTADPAAVSPRLRNHGALFLGPRSAEVFGDYAVGPNHVLPTGRGSRHAGGLSALTFLRVRTWLELREAHEDLIADAARFARLEGLEAHARAAERRLDGRR